MNKYKEIHLINFPKNTTILLKPKFRKQLIKQFIHSFSTWKQAINYLNLKSKKYKIKTTLSVGSLAHWFYGIEKNSGKTRRIPLWAITEITKITKHNLSKIENNLIDCNTTGRGTPVKIKFPMYLTPELVSIVFHIYGDGYLGGKGKQAHYRQVNSAGLQNFSNKLQNCFGKFKISISENSKIAIPKLIANFLREYFKLNDCKWNESRISEKIKHLPKKYLLAGLNSFIIDEGHIGEVIEIYSGNKYLLKDMLDLINKLGYVESGLKIKKEKTGVSYRIYISLTSALKFYSDILKLKDLFPTCGLAHKEHLLKEIIERQNKTWKKRKIGKTQEMILNLLSKNDLNSLELRKKLLICGSTLREHLTKLESQNKVKRMKPKKSCCLIWSKVK